ncbi:ABC transporter substrate-binding protein [soil metagenome]
MKNDSLDGLVRRLAGNRIDRRSFIKQATAFGLTGAAAASLGGRVAKADTPKRGGALVLGINNAESTDSLDPALYTSSFTQILGPQFYNSLVELDVNNQAQPSLATEWGTKPGAKEWTFKLRPGVTFHNGKEMQATDVIHSINHHRGADTKSAAKALLAPITEMTATGKHELKIVLSDGNADMPYMFADYHLGIMPEGAAGDKGIGTGAFILEKFEPGVRAITKRNPNYWNSDRGFVDSVETIAINDPTARMSALTSGAVHLVNQVDAKTFDLMASEEGIQTYSISGAQHYTFAMRCDQEPFKNADLRLAVKYAIDREELVKKILSGHGKVGNDNPIPSFDPFFAADIPQHAFDPDKAKFHLQKSGFSGTLPLSVSEVAFVGCTDAGALMQNSAAKAGIKIDVIREPADGYWSNVWMKKPWFASFFGGRPTADLMLSLVYKSDAEWNEPYWKRPDFDKLLLEARIELDQGKRKQMYHDLQAMIVDDGGELIPMFANTLEAGSKKVKGFVQLPTLEMSGLRVAEKVWLEE